MPGKRRTAVVAVATAFLLLLVAADALLATRHRAYAREIARLRAGMNTAERHRSDLIIQSEHNKLRTTLELIKRQARLDPRLHLSVAVDSGRMYLEREGALLRDMRVAVAPERLPAGRGDSVTSTVPRGQRMIVSIARGDSVQLRLNGGTRVYASDDTTSPPTPGDVRVGTGDMRAILQNVAAGMNVYFY